MDALGGKNYPKRWFSSLDVIIDSLRKVSSDSMMNADMVVELFRPQLEVTKKDIDPVIIMGLYHHRDLIGSREAFIKGNLNI